MILSFLLCVFTCKVRVGSARRARRGDRRLISWIDKMCSKLDLFIGFTFV